MGCILQINFYTPCRAFVSWTRSLVLKGNITMYFKSMMINGIFAQKSIPSFYVCVVLFVLKKSFNS